MPGWNSACTSSGHHASISWIAAASANVWLPCEVSTHLRARLFPRRQLADQARLVGSVTGWLLITCSSVGQHVLAAQVGDRRVLHRLDHVGPADLACRCSISAFTLLSNRLDR